MHKYNKGMFIWAIMMLIFGILGDFTNSHPAIKGALGIGWTASLILFIVNFSCLLKSMKNR